MEDKKGAKERLDAFTDFLRREERSKSTVEKYTRPAIKGCQEKISK